MTADYHDHPHTTGGHLEWTGPASSPQRPYVLDPPGERKWHVLQTIMVLVSLLALAVVGIMEGIGYVHRRERAARAEVTAKYARVLTACDHIARTAHEMDRAGIALDGDGRTLAAWWAEEMREK